MKSLIQTVAVAVALVVPAVCFAQSAPQSASPSADVGDYVQVVQVEEIDYAPAVNQNQPAAATAPDHTNAAQPSDADGYGGVANGTSKSGAAAYNPANDVGMKSIYMHH
jgi:hypothetical protein